MYSNPQESFSYDELNDERHHHHHHMHPHHHMYPHHHHSYHHPYFPRHPWYNGYYPNMPQPGFFGGSPF